jgi:hypothetical protein
LLDTVCDLLTQVPFSLLQPTGHVGGADTDLLAKGVVEPFELSYNFSLYIYLHGGRNTPQQNSREPKQDEGSNEHGNQQYGLHRKSLI